MKVKLYLKPFKMNCLLFSFFTPAKSKTTTKTGNHLKSFILSNVIYGIISFLSKITSSLFFPGEYCKAKKAPFLSPPLQKNSTFLKPVCGMITNF